MIRDLLGDWPGRLVMVFFIVILILLPIGFYYSAKAQAEWEDWCRSEGGRVDDVTKTSTGYSTDGKMTPITSTETTYYCLTDDGRVLDIK